MNSFPKSTKPIQSPGSIFNRLPFIFNNSCFRMKNAL
jgi:hypothetical protein